LIELNGGLRIGNNIIVDPTRRHPAAFVSHAHSDHLRRHTRIQATAATLELAKIRAGNFDPTTLEYGKTYGLGTDKIRLEPAGHILGSAQFIIDHEGQRVVYTGDFKLGRNETCLPAEIHQCDILFIDTTFGRRIFDFPDYEYARQRLLEFVEASLFKDHIPVIYAYTLGKSQEVMKILGDNGFVSYASPQACAYAEIYRRFGVDIDNFRLLDDFYPERGVIILPPYNKNSPEVFGGQKTKTCLVSGWALYKSHINFGWVDEAIPLSDHASYNDLLYYVEMAKPRKVYCLFGFPDIVDDLKCRGYNAVKATLANLKNQEKVIATDDLFE
jgi:putative mRNA 3-end processing factor